LILLIFAGSAAEFALNRAVDWLFFTGKIPNDPIGRLFSTVRYAQEIVFVDEDTAQRTLGRINAASSVAATWSLALQPAASGAGRARTRRGAPAAASESKAIDVETCANLRLHQPAKSSNRSPYFAGPAAVLG
jgi:hypothetical protein